MPSSPEKITEYTNALQVELARYSAFESIALIDADAGLVRAINGERSIDIPLNEAAFERAVKCRTLAALAQRAAHTAAIEWGRGKA